MVRFIRSAAGAIFFLLVGLGMVAGAVGALVAYLPDGVRDLRAYEAATPCRTVPIEPADCLWKQEFTVTEVDDPRGRGRGRYTILTDADGDRWRSTYGDTVPVWGGLAEGDRVTGTIWRGTLTEISKGGATQSTSEAPADMRARSAVLALILLPSGLSLAIVSGWRFARRRASPTLTPGQSASFWLSFGLLMAGLISPIPAALLPYGSELGHAGFTALVWLAIAGLGAGLARLHTVRERNRQPVP
ncbi:hypothetical protein [Actinomadura sp. 7K507]|uniref:hypothetical protein n=1 Tax=Actinomadura sp. 7K507 TaxID=2530365 RepID=UPI001051F612|nr:hypothetical protein [Actinomadura sp. 7K507]TDC90766.1 hypothetical protein E1285_14125 [Actinomadura sp. 7K507]